jgi:hypothetical protein
MWQIIQKEKKRPAKEDYVPHALRSRCVRGGKGKGAENSKKKKVSARCMRCEEKKRYLERNSFSPRMRAECEPRGDGRSPTMEMTLTVHWCVSSTYVVLLAKPPTKPPNRRILPVLVRAREREREEREERSERGREREKREEERERDW